MSNDKLNSVPTIAKQQSTYENVTEEMKIIKEKLEPKGNQEDTLELTRHHFCTTLQHKKQHFSY